MSDFLEITKELKKLQDKEKADFLPRFFKTGTGEYGEGDVFIGVTVPNSRKVARKYINSSFNTIELLLRSDIHEYRLTALLILVERFSKNKEEHLRKEIVELYINNYDRINNWDLVDLSCYKILGPWYIDKNKDLLYEWAHSNHLWKQRISIVTCMHFIRNNNFSDCLNIAEILLNHKHDLIHKAVGWLLREIGKRDINTEKDFLKKHYKNMPRTMLRYSIEKFSKEERQDYLKGNL